MRLPILLKSGIRALVSRIVGLTTLELKIKYAMEAREGHATNRPPLLEGTNYSYWKMRIKYYIQSVDCQC